MKAILTKYIGPTDTKPSRVIATDGDNRVMSGYLPDGISPEAFNETIGANAMTTSKSNPRFANLHGWLEQHSARALSSVDGPKDSTLTFYAINQGVVIVQEFANGNGWDIFVQPTNSAKVSDTFTAAEKALGLR